MQSSQARTTSTTCYEFDGAIGGGEAKSVAAETALVNAAINDTGYK
jgi:hypothetical protein